MTVHYASYGSNMDDRRFKPYVLGGPVPGTDIVERGSSDRTPIDLDRSQLVQVPGLLFTAGNSQRWEGKGVAFVDLADGQGHETIMRTYPLSEQQFADVVTQELDAGEPLRVDIDRIVEQGAVQVSPGAYGTVFHLGNIDGEPLLTFTAPFRADEVVHNKPNAAYVNRIRDGLVNAGLDADAAKAYVHATPGSKLGLTVPAHVAANREGPQSGRRGASASLTPPGRSRGIGSRHRGERVPASPLPTPLAHIAAAIPSVRRMAESYARLDRGWDPRGRLTNPGGGLTVYRRDGGVDKALDQGLNH
ncbi:hypothetical protein GCM10023205_63900 [Yinghuangia aomiensis]|uniref:Histone deacetylase n=1 Tax=Yinghuangia aomiensis TaxID=676205 RepID=A0ABP9I239_9ACTN